MTEPFHEGERLAQERAGETEMAAKVGAIIKDSLNGSGRAFLERQEMVVVATEAPDGAVWASLLFGTPGFVHSPNGREVVFDRMQIARVDADPFWSNLREQGDIGILAIDLGARRRLRVNTRTSSIDDAEIRAEVREAYPNCPKYIQRRRHEPSRGAVHDGQTREGTALDADCRGIVERADTFFMASRHPTRGADASHRGGPPGFAHVLGASMLRVPDYAGNGMFNTLGNLLACPRAGITIVDFDRGRVLFVTGTARVLFDQDDPRGEAGDTRRFWELDVARWVDSPMPVAWRWELIDRSPYNPEPRAVAGT
jgi:hypothetical protein